MADKVKIKCFYVKHFTRPSIIVSIVKHEFPESRDNILEAGFNTLPLSQLQLTK